MRSRGGPTASTASGEGDIAITRSFAERAGGSRVSHCACALSISSQVVKNGGKAERRREARRFSPRVRVSRFFGEALTSRSTIPAMPPRAAKRASGSSAGPVKKAVARTTRAKTAGQQQPEEPAERRVEEVVPVAEVKEEEVEEVVEVKEAARPEPEPEIPDANGSVVEEDVKEVYVEEDNDERLELDDNDIEYDPEEETGAEYDEKEMEDVGEEAEGDEVEEEEEEEEGDGGDIGENDQTDMIEEIESDEADAEGEEEEEDIEEEHEDVVEAEEQHEVVTERRKRKEFEVFVGGLDKDATEEDLKKVFAGVGEVVEVRLMKNPQTKKNKGFAFLRFARVEQAKRAVAELRNPVVNGKQCGVSPSQDNDTLFLGNICKTWTKEHLKEKLKQYGVDNIEDLTLVEDSNNEGNNRGFAFIEFVSRKDAMDAYRLLRKRDVVFGVDRSAKVAFADAFNEPNDEVMAQVKTVFVDGLPVAWDEERIRDYLKKFGQIEKIELARNMPSARRRDFGFVTFDAHDSAVKCAEGINNAELGEGDKKVKVRARLSRPLKKGRGKHGLRGDLRMGRGASRSGRLSWSRPLPRRMPGHSSRPFGSRVPPTGIRGVKRPTTAGFRSRRPIMAAAERVRHLPPPARSYERRPPITSYPKSTSKRDYIRRELPPRSKPPAEYGSRIPPERRTYRDEYASHGPSYADEAPRSASRTAARRGYADEAYGRRLERPPPTYRESHGRDYDSISGSKRPYAAIDDAPPRYADVSVRQSRPRFDYGISGSSEQYDAYGERLGRSHLGYSSTRSSLSGQESHSSMYSSSRHGISYPGGSGRGSDVGMYSGYTDSAYMSRSDVGGSSSYSSLYSSRGLGGSGYLGGSGSGSYY
ncbi:hypothetical protein Taro_013420 [Colocasia esculenta]|uniref:RRM domain-containing protein n=1 Tax=Colocasia esculenta TaxID=4460 RepID=A0A843UM16_COLES|nr:hypothetical protein [Colocasia esculenta]